LNGFAQLLRDKPEARSGKLVGFSLEFLLNIFSHMLLLAVELCEDGEHACDLLVASMSVNTGIHRTRDLIDTLSSARGFCHAGMTMAEMKNFFLDKVMDAAGIALGSMH
jgi:hypothetical protein